VEPTDAGVFGLRFLDGLGHDVSSSYWLMVSSVAALLPDSSLWLAGYCFDLRVVQNNLVLAAVAASLSVRTVMPSKVSTLR
jgi:hypothetical protein